MEHLEALVGQLVANSVQKQKSLQAINGVMACSGFPAQVNIYDANGAGCD